MIHEMSIQVKNLRLRTIIGIEQVERTTLQDVIVNAKIEVDAKQAAHSDDIQDTYNYKMITKKIIDHVENSKYFLLEKLVAKIVQLIMEDARVKGVTVEVDKPHALRFADSVSLKQTVRR